MLKRYYLLVVKMILVIIIGGINIDICMRSTWCCYYQTLSNKDSQNEILEEAVAQGAG